MTVSKLSTKSESNDLRLSLLGSPRILWNGAPVSIDRHKAIALLAYLCITGRTHQRDRLATLFWPDLDQARGRAALRRVLASLTSALPGPWWVTDRDSITFCQDGTSPDCISSSDQFWFDVREFRALRSSDAYPDATEGLACPDSHLDRLSRAVELFQGDFLEGFSLKDSAEYDDWQMNQGETLRQELAATLGQLIACHTSREEHETAIHFCRQWIQLDPLAEAAHEQLMRLYIAVGRPNSALQQFKSYHRLLESELGIPPRKDITQLYESIAGIRIVRRPFQSEPHENRLSRPNRDLIPAEDTARAIFSDGALTRQIFQHAHTGGEVAFGRERELELMAALWRQAKDGNTTLLLLSGEPGIGKTHLAQAFLSRVTSSEALVLRGECYPSAGMPYAPIAQVISDSFRSPGLENFASRLPAYVLADLNLIAPLIQATLPQVPGSTRLGPLYEQQRIFDSFVTFCELLIRSQQLALMLVFEDMHWSDVDSLQLLQYLVRRGRTAGLPLLVVITFRHTEVELAATSELQEMVTALSIQHPSGHVRLSGIDRQQTRDFVNNILGEVSDGKGKTVLDAVADAIYSQSEGNPFFVQELCRFLSEQAGAEENSRVPVWSGQSFSHIPETVRELILSRVRRLTAPCQEMLQQAAFLGRRFNVDVLQALIGLEEASLLNLVEEATRAYLLTEIETQAGPEISFTHQLIPFAVRESFSGIRRRREHQRIAEFLEKHEPENLTGLATHCAAAGRREAAIRYAQHAARQAMDVFAFESALQHLRDALDWVEGSRWSELHLSVVEDLGDVYRLMGQGAEAVTLFQEALTVWHGRSSKKERWAAIRLHRKTGETVVQMNLYADVQRLSGLARNSLESGLLLVDGEPAHSETVRLLAAMSRITWYMQSNIDWEAAEAYAVRAVKMAEALHSPLDLSAALEALGNAYGAKGQLDKRVEVCLQRLALSYEAQFNNLKELANILLQTGLAFYDVGDYVQSLEYLTKAEELGRQIRDISVEADALSKKGACLFRMDHWDALLAINSRIHELESDFTVKRMGVLTCFYYALQSNVHFQRGNELLGQALKREAYDMMVAVTGPAEGWLRNQHF